MERIKRCYLISYVIYLFFFLDSLLLEPMFDMNKYVSYLFPLIWVLYYAIESRLKINTERNTAKSTLILLFLYYVISAFLSLSSPMAYAVSDELRASIKFVIIISINIHMMCEYDTFKGFLACTYFTCALFFIYRFIAAGSPLSVLSNLNVIMSTDMRHRESFGLYNVNGTGNLVAPIIIISLMLIQTIEPEDSLYRIKKTVIYLFDAILIIVLLSTGSRNSILQLFIFFLIYLYMRITKMKTINSRSSNAYRVSILIGIIIAIVGIVWEDVLALFTSSLRLKGLTIDLPVYLGSNRLFQGLGLFNVGLFSHSQTAYGYTVNIDNYYMYVLVETGILGSAIITYILLRIFKGLINVNNSSESKLAMIIFSSFLAYLAAGLGETCVIYHVFPASMINFSIYLSAIKLNEMSDQRLNENDE